MFNSILLQDFGAIRIFYLIIFSLFQSKYYKVKYPNDIHNWYSIMFVNINTLKFTINLRKGIFRFVTRGNEDSNHTVLQQGLARDLKF